MELTEAQIRDRECRRSTLKCLTESALSEDKRMQEIEDARRQNTIEMFKDYGIRQRTIEAEKKRVALSKDKEEQERGGIFKDVIAMFKKEGGNK